MFLWILGGALLVREVIALKVYGWEPDEDIPSEQRRQSLKQTWITRKPEGKLLGVRRLPGQPDKVRELPYKRKIDAWRGDK